MPGRGSRRLCVVIPPANHSYDPTTRIFDTPAARQAHSLADAAHDAAIRMAARRSNSDACSIGAGALLGAKITNVYVPIIYRDVVDVLDGLTSTVIVLPLALVLGMAASVF